MAEETGIQWTDSTFNPWSGCAKISAGCAHCYAANLPPAMRRHAIWGPDGTRIRASADYLAQPVRWNAKAERTGIRRRVFCASVADVFEDRSDLDPWREELWTLIQRTPALDWQLVTKRPEVAVRWSESHPWPANAWIGASVEDQRAADERIPHLLRVQAAVRFLSCEPLLGPVDLRGYVEPTLTERAAGRLRRGRYPLSGIAEHQRLDWVIAGGESGPKARPMHPSWARSLRDQCVAAGVPFFFKQWGEWAPGANFPEYIPASTSTLDIMEAEVPEDRRMWRVGKLAAGRLLDGREWSEFPVSPIPTPPGLFARG